MKIKPKKLIDKKQQQNFIKFPKLKYFQKQRIIDHLFDINDIMEEMNRGRFEED